MSLIRSNDAAHLAGADEAAVRRAIASTARPPGASPASAALTFAWRSVLKVKHVPEQLTDATVMPVMFVLMFTYMLGGAVAGSTGEYRDYLVPGVLVMALVFNTVYSGTAINVDLTKGVIDRFRSLPVARSAPLLGSMLGDGVRYLIGGTVVVLVGVALGYRPGAGVVGVVAALALVVLFSFGLSWAMTALGLLLRSPNAVMSAGFTLLFPLTFLSNVFVPPQTLPGPLRAFVDVNPVSILTTACRGLMEGTAETADVAVVLAVAVALAAVFLPLTTRLYHRH
jgi:ABC-2 type transport system permease protein